MVLVALTVSVSGCEGKGPVAEPGAGRTVQGEAVLTLPVVTSRTLLEAVSKPKLVAGAYIGRVTDVRSYPVGGGEDVRSDVHLLLGDGSRVTYTTMGGTVPARELSGIADPPIGPKPTQAQLDEPVTVTLEGVLMPSVGQEVVAFYSHDTIDGKVMGGLTLVVNETAIGPRYSFPGKPLMESWKPPATDAELNSLLQAVHGTVRGTIGG